ncbi:Protein DJ-1 homolog B [Linum perenne]
MSLLRHVAPSPFFLFTSTITALPSSSSLTFTPKLSPSLRLPLRRLSSSSSAVAGMASAAKKVLVPIADGTEPMEAVITIDVLRRAGADVTVASVGKELRVEAAHGVKIIADSLVSNCVDDVFDLIALPGGLGGAQAFSKSEKLVNLLKKQCESNLPYGAICASPALVLEPHGLLKGKKATAFPAMCEKLSDKSEIENRVVVDGNLITSRGPGTSMEFALAIVEKLFGRSKAMELAKTMLFTA